MMDESMRQAVDETMILIRERFIEAAEILNGLGMGIVAGTGDPACGHPECGAPRALEHPTEYLKAFTALFAGLDDIGQRLTGTVANMAAANDPEALALVASIARHMPGGGAARVLADIEAEALDQLAQGIDQAEAHANGDTNYPGGTL